MARNGDVELAWDRAGVGPPLLLIHGLGYARPGWGPLRAALADHFDVISFDNRGIGESTVAPGPYDAATMATDALAVLDAAGVERAHVVGSSLGGMIAQELALGAPDRVDHLVLMSTTPGQSLGVAMPAVTTELLARAPSMAPADALESFVTNALGNDPDQSLVDEIMAVRLAQPQDPGGWASQAAAGTTYDGGDRVPTITHPTLVISGTADNVVDPANSVVLANHLTEAQLELVEGAGHLVFWERPQVVADLVTEFCR